MNSGSILRIDRSARFNPEDLLGLGWLIWRGPVRGDGLAGEEEQDSRALALTEIDLSKIQLIATLEAGESFVDGEKNLRRLKATGKVLLDAKVFETLWNNKHLIPQSWEFSSFPGTVLRSPDGRRYVLCLYRDGKSWCWFFCWLNHGIWGVNGESAVLEEAA